MNKLVLFLVFILSIKVTLGQQIHEPYDYPVRPGTERWKNAKNHDELRRLNQIPSYVIQKMDTQTLLHSVIRYPLIGDILMFPSFSRGTDRLKDNFFAFDSLLNRMDVIDALIVVYEAYEPSWVNQLQDPIETGEHILGLSLLEFIISDRAQHRAINTDQKHRLLAALVSKYGQKEELVDKYGGTTLSTCLWAASQLTIEVTFSELWIDRFLRDGFVLHGPYLDTLKKQIEKFR